MTERIKEQLSAFLDGELPEPESALLLKRLERDLELRGALSRWSLVGAVLRSDGDMPAAQQVAARVSAAIAREPARRPGAVALLRPLAGLGVAAAVAGVAMLLLQPAPLDAGRGGAQAAAELKSQAVRVAALPKAVPAPAAPLEETAPSYTTPPAAEGPGRLPAAQFANYLVAHSGYASPLARRSVVAGLIAEGAEPEGVVATPAAETAP